MKNFHIQGTPATDTLSWFCSGLKNEFSRRGFEHEEDDTKCDSLQLVFNLISKDRVRPFRRKSQATFVVSILETRGQPFDIFTEVYPLLIRSLSNHLIYINHQGDEMKVTFMTPEQGCYTLTHRRTAGGDKDAHFFEKVFGRLEPLAMARLVINNHFDEDLASELWEGCDVTSQLRESGKRLDELDLLPAPFPLENYLSDKDMRHLKKLYGIGGLSYGNLSARQDEQHFWMSASGINKADMKEIGRDMLFIKGYDEENNQIEVSIPEGVQPKRASVDAIEHWMIYREHPEVGAIVHIHAWMDGIEATEINYPCGTYELAENVAELIRKSEDPARAVIGLKNHGLTITGPSLDEIFDRIDGKIIKQVPMS
ncbi:class II aldolase/adducin family protein [Alteribacter natronophilus]|uniref:class II aldolase/adducin family protein n=1 Tax=Alteribacter natronophilus TaxID=2583810 RepID=UPI00110D3881|nr:class II aldolase/adducin family protein [Alteribacter natronophilus]TMW70959.1 class II aldolase/adducin family protein [Alteribacter natronophilus]